MCQFVGEGNEAPIHLISYGASPMIAPLGTDHDGKEDRGNAHCDQPRRRGSVLAEEVGVRSKHSILLQNPRPGPSSENPRCLSPLSSTRSLQENG